MVERKVTAQNAISNHPSQFCWIHEEKVLHRRPKLLFLARPFPPLRAISCVRTWNIAKYMARLGWEVTVVTPQPSVWRYRDNPEEVDATLEREGVRRILTAHRWRCLVSGHLNGWHQGLGWLAGGTCRKIARYLDIDSGIGWIKAADWACARLTARDVDVILATGSPFAAFRLAKRLSDRLGCSYVLDYRDPWTIGNPHAARSVRSGTIRVEARLLADCAAVTIVSPSWGVALDNQFGIGPKLHIIPNGFDPEELADVKPYKFDHFAIIYAGTFYPPKRVVTPLMAALKRLKETVSGQYDNWRFHYYGDYENHVREEAKRFGVMERVVLHGSVRRDEALAAVRGANISVVITSLVEELTLADSGMVTGKVFETLGLGTPTVLIAPPGSDIETIAETAGLGRRFTGSDIAGIAGFLAEVMCDGAPKLRNPEAYAWPNIVKKLDHVLRTAAGMMSGLP